MKGKSKNSCIEEKNAVNKESKIKNWMILLSSSSAVMQLLAKTFYHIPGDQPYAPS